MFKDFKSYKNCEPAGLTLPKISVDKEVLDELNLSEGASAYDVLRGLALKGIKKRKIDTFENKQEYYDRAKYELEVFNKLGFVDYLLLNWEIISFAVSHSITIGQGRGSAPSSLILYLLGVTGIDPIKYGLFFERFVSESRARKIIDDDGKEFLDGSLAPDVDTDIAHNQRQEVVSFIEERYKGRTAKILTFNTLSSKICIKECAKYFGEVNEEEANAISNLIPKDHGINQSLTKALEDEKFLEWAAKNPDILNHALVVENLNKNYGVHPSGIAIASEDISNLIPLQLSNGGDIISGYDMHDVADLMVKFDILGLRTLSIASLTCKKIGIELDDVDPEDPFVYEQLQDFKYPCGLFQISASVNSSVCQKVKPRNISELSDVVALARPQSLQFVDEYVRQKKNFQPLGINPILDEILTESKNVVLFQETLMQIANLVFGMSLDDAESLRRIVGKKKVKEVPAWKEKIYKAAEEKVLDIEVADYFWNVVEAAAGYSFNKSHSCAYSSLAAKTILLKFKYPQEFFCSILELAEFEQEPLQVIGEVEREIRNFGIELLPPQLDKSRMDFSIEGKDIRYGLKSIKGVSEQTKDALKIFAKNKTDNKYDVFILAKELKINIGVLSSLIYAGTLGRDKRLKIALEAQAFNLLTDRERRNFYLIAPEYSYNLLESILEVKESGRLADDGKPIMKKSRFDTFYKKFLPYKTLYVENKKYELLSTWWFEKKLLGYSYTNKLSDCFDKIGSISLNQIDSGENWRIVAFVEDVFISVSRRGNRYMSLTVSDETSQKRITLSDSPRENKLTNWLENNKVKKEDIIIAHGNANFIDHLEIIPIKVYSKARDLA